MLDQAAVIRALDHARIAEGPGGAAEMAPGRQHLRMYMYIGQTQGAQMKVIENLGVIDPDECVQSEP
jgi:urea transport system substrate-binding protein